MSKARNTDMANHRTEKDAQSASPAFPDPETADEDGVVCLGGDLSVGRLLLAYSNGIFPWPHWGMLLWFSPDPRCILRPAEVRVAKSMARVIKSGKFTIVFDQHFRAVISACSETPRWGQDGTWITDEIIEAYCSLHDEGYAHSVEAWEEGELVGGLYGVSLGGAFFGESMFSHRSNASKACFIALARKLEEWGFDFIDCQLPTDHLMSLGACVLTRAEFLKELKKTISCEPRRGQWQ